MPFLASAMSVEAIMTAIRQYNPKAVHSSMFILSSCAVVSTKPGVNRARTYILLRSGEYQRDAVIVVVAVR